jgi:hypothetical protein
MPKQAPDATIDAMLDYIAGATAMHAISAYAADDTYATVTGNSLADVVMAGGDFTKAAGDTSGRKVTVAAKSGVNVDVTGTATHVALVNTAGTTVRYVTTCTSQALTSGNTVNFPSWKVEVNDPT